MLGDEGLAICCWECSWLGGRRMLGDEGLAYETCRSVFKCF